MINETHTKMVQELLKMKVSSNQDLMLAKRKLAKKYSAKILSNAEVLEHYKDILGGSLKKADSGFLRAIRKRAIRTMSGVAPVAVLTKPYECPGKCAYCPTEKDVPQSYLSNEPAVMRAIRCNYNPYIQVQDRLRALVANAHQPTKIELIVIGGTWSYFPEKYKYWYILNCFKAANEFDEDRENSMNNTTKLNAKLSDIKTELAREQKKNEKTKYKIIGLTLETRPDYINEAELTQMRDLGCTRVEIGVQSIFDDVLKKNKRGHLTQSTIDASKLMRDFGFKFTYHLMPGLPGSTAKRDVEMFEELFNTPNYQPDQIKFYPTVVTKGSLLYRWWKKGEYKPYSDKVLQNLIIKCKEIVPEYVRIIRLIRDIPGESIIAGNLITNLRQVMKDRGVKCNCIRCREAKDKKFKVSDLKIKITKYQAGNGEEQFITFTDKSEETLFGFCRLRLSDRDTNAKLPKALVDSALIRELHVYGELVSGGSKKAKTVQHKGIGSRLVEEAEKIARKNNYKNMAIISGVGVRGFYRRLGYRVRDTYMFKKL